MQSINTTAHRMVLASLVLLLSSTSLGEPTVPPSAQLTWDYEDPLPELVDGFRIICAGSTVWEGTEYPVALFDTTMVQGRQDCHVVAYNAIDTSLPSNVVSVKYVTGKPVPPASFRYE